MWSEFVRDALRRWSRHPTRRNLRYISWDYIDSTWTNLAKGALMSSTDDAKIIFDAVEKVYRDQPWYKGATLDVDDAGVHVVVHVQKSALPPEGVEHIGVVDGVRVLMAVHQ